MVSKTGNVSTDHQNSFINDTSGNVAVNTVIADAVEGSFAFSGLSTEVKVSNVVVGDAASTLPLVALTNRNSLIIQNTDTTNSIYIGSSNVASTGANEGWVIGAGEFFSLDITDSIDLYAIASTGKTVSVKIMELA
jgi:hypothetical protein